MKSCYSLKVGKKIIPFKCKSLIEGENFDLSQIRKPVFALFWCVDCICSLYEMANINNKVINLYKEKVDFLFINCGDNIDDVNEYFNKNRLKMSLIDFKTRYVCVDYFDYITNLINIVDIPTSIIIDENLFIRSILVGKNKVEKYLNCIDNVLSNLNNQKN